MLLMLKHKSNKGACCAKPESVSEDLIGGATQSYNRGLLKHNPSLKLLKHNPILGVAEAHSYNLGAAEAQY